LISELDAELIRLNDDYEAKRKGLGLEPPVVRMVAPGTFEQWMRARGKWGGQSKMPRCRSDREIADELVKLVQPSTRSAVGTPSAIPLSSSAHAEYLG
jgi:hypothetical protein